MTTDHKIDETIKFILRDMDELVKAKSLNSIKELEKKIGQNINKLSFTSLPETLSSINREPTNYAKK